MAAAILHLDHRAFYRHRTCVLNRTHNTPTKLGKGLSSNEEIVKFFETQDGGRRQSDCWSLRGFLT